MLVKMFENERMGIRVELHKRKNSYVLLHKECIDASYEIMYKQKIKYCRIAASSAFEDHIRYMEDQGVTFPIMKMY